MSSDDALEMVRDTRHGDVYVVDSPKHRGLLVTAMEQLFESNAEHYIRRIELGGLSCGQS